ncbi:type IV secretion system protein VirB10 [Pseudoduganella lurida]|uniref:Type IV secretion system protein VirB10 n=1 Tax=Pseudoduganella lurida TaxID=1036180 RepID=A0A562R0F8_9BURK|nr:TrbI/VirB10 family protein [Pseudoduganella lurida]TWI62552.1 type IV secretion system protein VirB10 [Pseudoduganella lurida]
MSATPVNPSEMSPDHSPRRIPARTGVRRVNNLPVYIVGGLLAIFLTIMATVAADRAEKQARPPEPAQVRTGNTKSLADQLAGPVKDGQVAATAPATRPVIPPEPSQPAPVQAENLDAPPLPPGARPLSTDPAGDELRTRLRSEKIHQFEEAVKARTTVQATAPRSAASSKATGPQSMAPLTRDDAVARIDAVQQQIDAQMREDPAAQFQARLQQIRAAGVVPADAGAQGLAPDQAPAVTRRSDYSQFSGSGAKDRWQHDQVVEAPRSPYELRAGFVIPAILISGINSDLPGFIIGQVSQDVFDTATGRWKLVPQGSRLVGRYSSDVAYGQARVLVAWQRIIFPDGKALDLDALPGADGAGYAGFTDRTNNHYFRIFGSALLMSGVTAGIAISQPDATYNDRQSARSAMSEALGQQLGMATAQMIAKNMSIAPTLEIRPGYRFNVVVTKDLTFSKPYRPFDY